MKEYLKCRACGYIMNKEGAPDICPACGVGSKAFEEYKYNVSEFRRKVMSLDIHPVVLHIPQAVSVLIPLFIVLSFFISGTYAIKLIASAEILTLLFPLSVAGSIATGIFDGRIRFKKISTPALKRKMMLGTLLLIISCAMFLITVTGSFNEVMISIALLSVLSMAVEITLARIGIKLMYAHMPG